MDSFTQSHALFSSSFLFLFFFFATIEMDLLYFLEYLLFLGLTGKCML